MVEPNLTRSVPLLVAGYHAAPLLMLTAAVFFAWMYVALNDASSALLILLTAGFLVTFAIQSGLLLAPGL
jgi:hypothetical protein